jgi:phosphoribosyl-dephospho-CoA transferase
VLPIRVTARHADYIDEGQQETARKKEAISFQQRSVVPILSSGVTAPGPAKDCEKRHRFADLRRMPDSGAEAISALPPALEQERASKSGYSPKRDPRA